MASMDSATQSVVSNVLQLLGEEYRLLRDVGGQVGELRDDLEAINALLVMQLEAEDGAVDRFVQVCMKQLRELAYDSEDCVDLYKLRIKCRPGDCVRARFKHIFQTLFARRRLAGEISALQARAVAIGDRQARFGVNRDALRRRSRAVLPAPSPAPASAVNAGSGGSHHHQIVGIEGQADALVQKLAAHVDDEEGRLKVLSIVGFGGLGKTTLAMEVCRRLEPEFPHQAMVSVSQAFEPSRDLPELLKRVLEQIVNPKTGNEKGIKEEGGLRDIDCLDVTGLGQKLEECLQGKRYLIVIDDVWTTRAWEAIQPLMPQNKSNSRVMVTTRIEAVAKACSLGYVSKHGIHHMEHLKYEDSEKLFLSRVFGSMNNSICPREFKVAMGNILKKCGGLPLAIISIASILAGYRSPGNEDTWHRVCKSIGSHMDNNPTLEGLRQIVTLSFNHLPHELKACMMYLSIFPEDYVIEKQRLVCRWIAEGLVHEKRGLTTKEVAESYLEELLSRNMIQEDHYNYEISMTFYRIHDMLLEVMVSKSLEANFVSLQGGQYNGISYDKIRRLSIHGDILSLESAPKEKEACRKFNNDMNVQHIRSLSVFQLEWHKLLDQLDKFTLLRVLDLEGCKGVTNKHMRYACQLYLLKFLSLKETDVSEVPPQIKNLKHLQTFDVSRTLLSGLPETITNLEKLRTLWFSNRNEYDSVMWKLPRGLKKMKALREVTFAVLGNDVQVAREIGELEIDLLDLFIGPQTIDDDVLKELALSLSKNSLRQLYIGDLSNRKLLKFLHRLPIPPPLMRNLRIGGDADGLPSWIKSLMHLSHFGTYEITYAQDQLFNILCKLPSLRSLHVYWKSYSGNQVVAQTKHTFPMLSDLKLGGKLPNIYRFEAGSMANLETLEIRIGINKVECIEGVEHLTSLKKVTLWGNKYNNALNHALEQLKTQSNGRSMPHQFQVVAKYY
ncbi:hypothetical protein ACP4OV_012200 [Aristida adscensionis]